MTYKVMTRKGQARTSEIRRLRELAAAGWHANHIARRMDRSTYWVAWHAKQAGIEIKARYRPAVD
jgi:hypothetical protein